MPKKIEPSKIRSVFYKYSGTKEEFDKFITTLVKDYIDSDAKPKPKISGYVEVS